MGQNGSGHPAADETGRYEDNEDLVSVTAGSESGGEAAMSAEDLEKYETEMEL